MTDNRLDAHDPERKPPHDEIDLLKGQIAALSHCLGVALTLLDRLTNGAIGDLIDRANVITTNDLRREGIEQVLSDLRDTLERHAS